MEVIKHGDTYKEIECPKCGALLSYCKRDIKEYSKHGERFGEMHSYYKKYINCLECNHEIVLEVFAD